MLPNFVIIGTEKAATTWLAKCLGQHPDVFMAEVKETYFFSTHFKKGPKWYESQHFGDWAGQTAIGEATPGYINNPEVPGRIQSALGDEVKLIASLRHPVDRAYSAFWMRLSRGDIPFDADFRTIYQRDEYGLRTRGNCFVQLSRYLEYFPRENLSVLIYEELKRDNQKALFVWLSTCLATASVRLDVGMSQRQRIDCGKYRR